MYLLLSGEGSSDIGICHNGSICEGVNFREGPMAIIIDQMVEVIQRYEMSHLTSGLVGYVSESYLASNKQRPLQKSMSLKGKKRPAETKYFFENARALAVVAKNKADEINDSVVAVLFRDADCTASAGRGNWSDKRSSINAGFEAAGYNFGVAMVPNPKSEAWLLCAIKENPYQHCSNLESESGNDNGAFSLKDQIQRILSTDSNGFDLNQLILEKQIDITQIDMPSFNAFKSDLEKTIKLVRERL